MASPNIRDREPARDILQEPVVERIPRNLSVRFQIPDDLVDPLIWPVAQRGKVFPCEDQPLADPTTDFSCRQRPVRGFAKHLKNNGNNLRLSVHVSTF